MAAPRARSIRVTYLTSDLPNIMIAVRYVFDLTIVPFNIRCTSIIPQTHNAVTRGEREKNEKVKYLTGDLASVNVCIVEILEGLLCLFIGPETNESKLPTLTIPVQKKRRSVSCRIFGLALSLLHEASITWIWCNSGLAS